MCIGPCIVLIAEKKGDQLDVPCFIISLFNPLALELNIYSLAHHLCTM